MPESTLSLTIDDLKAAIGSFLGYGRGTVFSESAWTTEQSNNITDMLKTGLSQVYTPPPLGPNEPPHSWSFLRPFAEIATTSGSRNVPLPDSFGGFEGPMYIMNPGTAGRQWELPVANIGRVQQMIAARPDDTGYPRLAAEQVLDGTGPNRSTRTQLLLWPTPDASYTLAVEYKHMPDALTGALPYPPGGSEHAELFKASMIAACELYLDDTQGPRWAYFVNRLAASVHADRKRKGIAQGYNGDRSDTKSVRPYDRGYYTPVRFNGEDF